LTFTINDGDNHAINSTSDAVYVTDNSLLYSFALTANGSNFDLDVTKAAISSVGVDSDRIAKDATVGIALGYADSHIKSDNVNTTKSDMNSYNISVYGDYEINSRTYVSGNVSYSHNTIDQVRHNVGGGAGLDVESDDLDVFEIGLGAEVSWDFVTDSGAKLRPSLNTGYRYDLIGDSIDAKSTFIAGGSAFSTDGADPAQGTFNVGAAISYAMDDNWELSADYGVEVKDEYNSHTGHIRADYKF